MAVVVGERRVCAGTQDQGPHARPPGSILGAAAGYAVALVAAPGLWPASPASRDLAVWEPDGRCVMRSPLGLGPQGGRVT